MISDALEDASIASSVSASTQASTRMLWSGGEHEVNGRRQQAAQHVVKQREKTNHYWPSYWA